MDQAGATATVAVVKSGQPSLAASATYASLLAGQKHTVNDITRKLVDKGNVEQAVEVFYQCLLLGWKEGRTDLLAASTIDVSKSGPQYIQMLADVNARLTRDGYGQAVAHVFWTMTAHLCDISICIKACCWRQAFENQCTASAAARHVCRQQKCRSVHGHTSTSSFCHRCVGPLSVLVIQRRPWALLGAW
ncbi:hypothetical protein ABBQ38_013788 [Trebouxia sp. C0009 RCD-2024]